MKKLGFLTFYLAFFITACVAQDSEQELHDFQIVVEVTDDGFKLSSPKGCAWIDLSFTLKPDSVQYVNQNGMTSAQETSDSKQADNLLFKISKSEKSVILEGLEGTAWTRLEFSASRQAINQYGMTHLD